mgnify:CR=1 FL=1
MYNSDGEVGLCQEGAIPQACPRMAHDKSQPGTASRIKARGKVQDGEGEEAMTLLKREAQPVEPKP